MQLRPPKVGIKMGSGLSSHTETPAAAEHACAQAALGLDGQSADLVLVFFTPHHIHAVADILAWVRRTLNPGCLVGVSAESVAGGATELERVPGISILAAHLPGVTLKAFTAEEMLPADDSPQGLARIAQAIGAGPSLQATFFFADPFSVPLIKLLPALNKARSTTPEGRKQGVIIGGMASGARTAGGNRLILNDRVVQSGAVGVSLSGPITIDAVVSQGCAAFGPTAIVTKAKGNVIFELGGKPTADTVKAAIADLGPKAQAILKEGLLLGRVINEYKDRFGRSDFLISNVVGLDATTGGIAVGDLVRVGQTVRFHHRDKVTAAEDLAMLMDAQKLYDRPAGCLLITCNGRGTRLFNQQHNDAATIARAFARPPSGEELAKGGRPIEPPISDMPLAGFFAAGEIGPVGDESFVHGHTACVVMFREPTETRG